MHTCNMKIALNPSSTSKKSLITILKSVTSFFFFKEAQKAYMITIFINTKLINIFVYKDNNSFTEICIINYKM